MAGEYLTKRGAYWHYVRRIPSYVSHLDQRGFIRISTRKANRSDAVIIADRITRETDAFWQTLLKGETPVSITSYENAIKRARALGMNYKPALEIASGETKEIIERTQILEEASLVKNKPAVDALLGGTEKPDIKLSKLLDFYFDLARDNIRGKSEDQIRKWRNPRKKAVANLIRVIGDKSLSEISRHDALDFRAWWIDRIENEDMDPGTANKDIGAINQIINDIDDKLRLGLGRPFGAMRLRGEKHNPRIAYDPGFVQDKLLAPEALDGLNLEARVVIYVMAGTGARPSEIVHLAPSDIHLEAQVPYISIRPHERHLKTDQSQREIPLVGVALAGLRLLPEGFSRYRNKTDSLSASINKFLMEHDLRPTPEHTLYSLRHTFQDRLIAIEAPERIQAELMGHKFFRPKYGSGPSLEQKAFWLEKIAYHASYIQ